MPLYNIGFDHYENSQSTQFEFDQKLTQEQLQDHMRVATTRALEYAVASREEFFFTNGGINFEVLYPRVIVELEKEGFHRVQYDGEWRCFGLVSVTAATSESGAGLARISAAIPYDLKQKTVEMYFEQERSHDFETLEYRLSDLFANVKDAKLFGKRGARKKLRTTLDNAVKNFGKTQSTYAHNMHLQELYARVLYYRNTFSKFETFEALKTRADEAFAPRDTPVAL